MAPSFLDAIPLFKGQAGGSSPPLSSMVTNETAKLAAVAAGGLVLWATRAYALHYTDVAISFVQVRITRRTRQRQREEE